MRRQRTDREVLRLSVTVTLKKHTSLKGYYGDDVLMRRQKVLTSEGVLVVIDTVVADDVTDGSLGGPVWHFVVPNAPIDKGLWFDVSGFYDSQLNNISATQHLLVYFDFGSGNFGRYYGVKNASLWGNTNPFTIYAAKRMISGAAARFVSLLQPFSGQSADYLAQSVFTIMTEEMISVRYRSSLDQTRCLAVVINHDSTWLVKNSSCEN